MRVEQWQEAQRFVLGILLGARPLEGTPRSLMLFNAEQRDGDFPLPEGLWPSAFAIHLTQSCEVMDFAANSDSFYVFNLAD